MREGDWFSGDNGLGDLVCLEELATGSDEGKSFTEHGGEELVAGCGGDGFAIECVEGQLPASCEKEFAINSDEEEPGIRRGGEEHAIAGDEAECATRCAGEKPAICDDGGSSREEALGEV